MERDLMSPHFAVFNLHVNFAGKRALDICQLLFKDRDELVQLESAWRTGIMKIFNDHPNEVTRTFSYLCYVFVNGLDKNTDADVKEMEVSAERRALDSIVSLYPDPGSCAELENIGGVNDGKMRAIVLKSALNIARKAVGKEEYPWL